MTRIHILIFFICTLFVLPVLAGKKLHIDSFDDGNSVSEQGGWWFIYNDGRLGGNTEITPAGPALSPQKGNDEQGYAIHAEGTTGNKLGWDYFGFGVTLTSNSGCPSPIKVDISQYTTLEFKMKGDATGGRLVVLLLYTGDTCEKNVPETLTHWADYEASVTSDLSDQWTTVRLNLRNDFAQPYWTKPGDRFSIEDVLKKAGQIQWHYSSADGESLNVWIDDVYLY